jgi:hypothetical protein
MRHNASRTGLSEEQTNGFFELIANLSIADRADPLKIGFHNEMLAVRVNRWIDAITRANTNVSGRHGRSYGICQSPAQFGILLPGQTQPDSTSAYGDTLVDCLTAGEIEVGSPHLWMTRLEYSPILLPCQCTTANRERSSQTSMW